MTPQIQYNVEASVVRVTYSGKVMYGVTTEAIRKAARLATEAQIKRLLFDLRNADYEQYFAGTVQHAEEGPAMGVDKSFRIAFLGTEKQLVMLRFIEDVSVNRGYLAKIFVDEAQAVAWIGRDEP